MKLEVQFNQLMEINEFGQVDASHATILVHDLLFCNCIYLLKLHCVCSNSIESSSLKYIYSSGIENGT